ncbi:MAG: hypothetical protein ACRDOH_11285, partial [Streptosporangiaceae bacterium]
MAILNSAMVATAVWVINDWTRSAWSTAAAATAILWYLDARPLIIADLWMPYWYVPAFLCFIISAASVAAGRARHVWILTVTGCLLIHGHACFLLFVPVTVAAAAAAAVFWSASPSPLQAIRRFLGERKRTWIPAAVICAVFAIPIVANVILHWPGQFGGYLSYARSVHAGHHPLSAVARYVLWYWWPGHAREGLAVAAGTFALALGVTLRLGDARLRRFLLAALGVNVLVTVLMLYYVARGIDTLNYPYMGYFYWSVPLLTAVVAVTGLRAAAVRAGGRLRTAAAGAIAAAAGAAIVAALVVPGMRMDVSDNEPVLVTTMAALAGREPGHPVI